MPYESLQKKLRVIFEFPGASSVLYVHVNRQIAVMDDSGDYKIPTELNAVFASVPGLMANSYHRAETFKLTTECGTAFDPEDLLLETALALGKYFRMDDADIEVGSIIDRRPALAFH